MGGRGGWVGGGVLWLCEFQAMHLLPLSSMKKVPISVITLAASSGQAATSLDLLSHTGCSTSRHTQPNDPFPIIPWSGVPEASGFADFQ